MSLGPVTNLILIRGQSMRTESKKLVMALLYRVMIRGLLLKGLKGNNRFINLPTRKAEPRDQTRG